MTGLHLGRRPFDILFAWNHGTLKALCFSGLISVCGPLLVQVLGTKCLVPRTWYQVSGTRYQLLGTKLWYQVLGTRHDVKWLKSTKREIGQMFEQDKLPGLVIWIFPGTYTYIYIYTCTSTISV